MGKLASLNVFDRPREKAKRFGLHYLSDVELLALILGNGVSGVSVLEVSYNILNDCGGVKKLFDLSYDDLKKIKGIGEAKSLLLLSIFELTKRKDNDFSLIKNTLRINNDYLSTYIKRKYYDQNQEVFILILVNKLRNLQKEVLLYKGTENQVNISIKDILGNVLKNCGNYFYIIHTHPNSKCCPSSQDVELTKKISIESNKIGLHLIDHIIIGEDGYYSFLDNKINFIH